MAGERDIEEHFARATLAFLRGQLRPSGGDCPHPGFLSVHLEGKLEADEAESVEAHLGVCPDCRERLATLANLEPVASAVPIEPEPEPPREPEPQPEPDPEPEPEPEPDPEPPPEPEPAIAVVETFDVEAGELEYAAKPTTNPRVRSIGLPAIVAVIVLGGAAAYQFSSLLRNPRAMLERWVGSPEKAAEPEAIVADAPSAAQSPAIVEVPAVAPPPIEPVKRPAVPASPVRKVESVPVEVPAAAPPSAAAEIVIAARVDGDVRWRFRGSTIERSDDGGRSWRGQTSHATSPLLAASAPSGKACWAGGRNGTVVRTSDGRVWEVVRSPTADDIVQVTALSTDSATVRSARGHRYATVDGGATWSLL